MAGVYTLFADREIPCELRDENQLTNGPEKKNLRVRICVLGDEQGLLSVKVGIRSKQPHLTVLTTRFP
jgi:hypothetical protein